MKSDIFVEAWEGIAPREREVLGLIAENGLENAQVAEELGIAVSTVETHRARGLKAIAQYARLDSVGLRLFTSLWWKHVRKR